MQKSLKWKEGNKSSQINWNRMTSPKIFHFLFVIQVKIWHSEGTIILELFSIKKTAIICKTETIICVIQGYKQHSPRNKLH